MPALLFLLGAEMRIRQYVGGRSLWLDEAMISDNIVNKTWIPLLRGPLLHHQVAPPLWLWAEHFFVRVFGVSEHSLRVVPLVSGLAVLALTWLAARKALSPALAPVALAVVVLNPQLLYYSNEVKQYGTDAAVVVGAVLLALYVPAERAVSRWLVALSVYAVIAVWASHVIVFVLAALSLVLVLRPLVAGHWRRALGTGIVLSPWVLSFGVAYLAIYKKTTNDSGVNAFWNYTFPLPGDSLLDWLHRRYVDLMSNPLDLHPAWLGLLLFLVGAALLAARRPATGAVVLASIVIALGVAHQEVYPFAARLALWTVPLVAIALAALLPWRLDVLRLPWLLVGVVLLAVAVAPAAGRSLPQTTKVQGREELRPVMAEVRRNLQPGDQVIVGFAAVAAWDFYVPLTGLHRTHVVILPGHKKGAVCNDPATLANVLKHRTWIVFSHQLSGGPGTLGSTEPVLAAFGEAAPLLKTISRTGAHAYLYGAVTSVPPTAGAHLPDRCLSVVASAH